MSPIAPLLAETSAAAGPAAGWTLQLLILLVLVVLSGAFSGSETVLFSLTPHQLQTFRADRNPLRRLAARLMTRPKQTLMTILLGNTCVNVLLFATTYVLTQSLHASLGWWVLPIGAAISLLVVLVAGEVIPKVLGVALADRLAPYSAAVVHFSGYVLRPIAWLIDHVLVEPSTRLLLGPAGRQTAREHDLTTDELKTLLEMNQREGLINRIENLYLREVIDLRDIRVADIMVPRVELTAFEIHGSSDELRELMRRTRRTKVPVYDGTIDNTLGLIYAKILFFDPDRPLRELISPVHYVPEVINCEQLLEHFRKTRSQLAMVVDEFGGIEGLVTLEDVIEEIVGEIRKPEDQPEPPELIPISDTEYHIAGTMSVRYWAETFGIPHLTERVATVAGLLACRLGRPPRVGDAIRVANTEITVLEMAGRRPARLRVRLLAPQAEQAS